MISKPRPTAAQRVRQENRWNTPFGFSISLGLHATFITLFVLFAAGVYIESRSHETATKAHDIVVQTLVRQPQPLRARTMPRSVAVHPAVSQPAPIVPVKTQIVVSRAQAAATRHAAAKPLTSAARGRLVALAILAALHPAHPRVNKQTSSHGGPKIEIVTDATSSVSTTITSSNTASASDPNATGASATDDSTGPVGRAHSGTVWSERPPAGRFGHGADAGGIVVGGGNCTPTRGGFLLGH